jgi:hypothetical protein
MELVGMAYHNRGRGDSNKPSLGVDISGQWVKKHRRYEECYLLEYNAV